MGISELKEIAEALEKLSNIKDLDIDIQINIKNRQQPYTIINTPWTTDNWDGDWWKNRIVYYSGQPNIVSGTKSNEVNV